jgi:hypothetical protein
MQPLACHPDEGRIGELHKRKRLNTMALLTIITSSTFHKTLLSQVEINQHAK